MVWTAPFMINSVFVPLSLIKEVYQFTNVTAFIFIGNWVSHDDEFIYMARFFETEKKAQKTGTNFFKCWFWPGFSCQGWIARRSSSLQSLLLVRSNPCNSKFWLIFWFVFSGTFYYKLTCNLNLLLEKSCIFSNLQVFCYQ